MNLLFWVRSRIGRALPQQADALAYERMVQNRLNEMTNEEFLEYISDYLEREDQ